METISIEVEPEIARAYQEANLMECKKMQIILNSSLKQFMNRRSLEEIIQEMQSQAQANGLTPEILEKLLEDE